MTTREVALAASANGLTLRRAGGAWIDAGVGFGTLVVLNKFFPALTAMQSIGWVVVLWGSYFIVMEATFGATLGKFATNLRVVDHSGNKPSLQAAIVRNVLRLLEANPLLLGGIPAGLTIYLSKSKQRLGDMAAGTFVLTKQALAVNHLGPFAPAPIPAIP